ncbi:hypothetical protein A0128_20170 [Leptospira tipperaryensis]|uniref:HTH crp-type domain-containing protein n=1 Tax=Leptospira tipperaryensis TaxID=2564040 RepID=A0A1D7V3A8_9LEPT|nr:helix-turn-helix domain-containing protein [Leptospira tipperaryensis]AOP36337.1 hypothetical protein A0128_20170 [Leptospira tipperaryensis]
MKFVFGKNGKIKVYFEDLRYFGKRTPELAWLFAEECSRREYARYGIAFTSVRQRLVRHLLLNAISQESPPFRSVKMFQQDLADSIGTVREVVVRELRSLKKEGLIASSKGRIEIVRPGDLLVLSEESS